MDSEMHKTNKIDLQSKDGKIWKTNKIELWLKGSEFVNN